MNASLHIDLTDDVDDKKFFLKRQFVVCVYDETNYIVIKKIIIKWRCWESERWYILWERLKLIKFSNSSSFLNRKERDVKIYSLKLCPIKKYFIYLLTKMAWHRHE